MFQDRLVRNTLATGLTFVVMTLALALVAPTVPPAISANAGGACFPAEVGLAAISADTDAPGWLVEAGVKVEVYKATAYGNPAIAVIAYDGSGCVIATAVFAKEKPAEDQQGA